MQTVGVFVKTVTVMATFECESCGCNNASWNLSTSLTSIRHTFVFVTCVSIRICNRYTEGRI
jgi:hypothetical protein